MKDYWNRIVDRELDLRLEAFGATLIVGPKWCGKTTTAEEKAKSVLKMQDPDMRDGYLATAKAKPSLLLKGENPRLIDEWQEAPVLWDAVRTAVDDRQEEGLFILTGSTSVDDSQIHHSGTGRISRLKMYPMSLYESRESNGSISLKELFEHPEMDIDGIMSDMRIEDLIFAACRGGWPSALRKKSDAAKLIVASDYLKNVCETDISTVDGVTRNPVLAELILKSYARNISTLAKKNSIYKDVAANVESLSMPTLDSYITALTRLFVIEDIDAWCPAIRSATTIRSGKKRAFIDPSIAIAALGLSPDYLEKDLKTFGFIFECMCIRDLKVYSQALKGKVSYYHDRYDLEADAVLHIGDGRYALIEFKLGSAEIEEGAKHLLKIKQLVQMYNKTETQVPLREPDLLLVITGGNMAYTRQDGVKVIPIGCLKD
ncbi:MAG: ATP-binding protein [Lachnospiraceae bacterium]|nr:ATP-binding protein [Lachnospiraceae bacterium]